MSDVVFRLFGDGGFVNPVPHPRFSLSFYEHSTGKFSPKQSSEFDGGWRWFDAHNMAALTIYNVKLHRQAYHLLTHEEIEDTCNGAEFVLLCAQSKVIVEHNFFNARDYVQDVLRAEVAKLRQEIFGAVHSVR
jgi:hypothetical protein